MQVAHRSYVVSMLDGARLREIVEREKPDYIIPEIEAVATDVLLELEKEGYRVVPTARAAMLTMDRAGDSPACRRDPAVADFAVSFRGDPRRVRAGCRRDRLSVRGQADHEFVRTRAERRPQRRGYRLRLAQCAAGRPGGSRESDRRGIRKVRLRDYAADGAPLRGNFFSRADRALSTGRRLPRVVAAAADDGRRKEAGRRDRPPDYRRIGRTGPFRRGTFRAGRPGDLQRSIAPAARYGNGNDDFAGSLRVCAACTGDPGASRAEYRVSRVRRLPVPS